MHKLNAAIIGCGAIGPVHAAAIAQSGAANLYAVCDLLDEKAHKLSKEYNCKIYTLEEVLADEKIDSVHICTPHYLHKDMAVKAASAGKHIVLEKPVGLNSAQAKEVYKAVEDAGIACCAILQNRFNPSIQKAKEYIDEGILGKMLGIKGFLTWKRTAQYYGSAAWRGKWETEGGGLLINQAVHMLDMLYYLGGDIEAVKGNIDTRVLNDSIEVEDTAEATLYFKDGKIGLFYGTNCYSEDSPFFIEMHFERGLLRYMDNKLVLKTGEKEEILASDARNTVGKTYWGNSHGELISNFYESIAGSEKKYTTLKDASYSMGLLDAIYSSAKTGKKEKIEV